MERARRDSRRHQPTSDERHPPSTDSCFPGAIPDCSARSTSCWSAPVASCSTTAAAGVRFRPRGRGPSNRSSICTTRRVTPRDLPNWHYDEISASFRAGHAAPSRTGRAAITCTKRRRAGWRTASSLALLPTGPAGKRAAYAGCHSFAIPRASADTRGRRRPDCAPDLVRGTARRRRGEARSRAAPARSPRSVSKRPLTLPSAAMAAPAETEQTMIIPPRFAAYPQCEDVLWRSVQQAMTGDLSPPMPSVAPPPTASIVADESPRGRTP